MKSMRLLFFGVFFLLCFTSGLLSRAYLEREKSEAEKLIELFDKACGPKLRGDKPFLQAELIEIVMGPDTHIWIESDYAISVEISKNRCDVSDMLKELSAEFRKDLTPKVEKYVTMNFPKYQRYQFEDQSNADLDIFWTSSPEKVNCSPYIRLLRYGEERFSTISYLVWSSAEGTTC